MYLWYIHIFRIIDLKSNIARSFEHIVQKTKKEKRKGVSAIGCKYQWQRYISWIIRARWRKREEGGESTTSARACVWKKKAESPENFPRSNTTSSRSEALLHYETTNTPPSRLFLRYIRLEFRFSLLALPTPKFRWEKSRRGIYQEICNRETWCAVS